MDKRRKVFPFVFPLEWVSDSRFSEKSFRVSLFDPFVYEDIKTRSIAESDVFSHFNKDLRDTAILT